MRIPYILSTTIALTACGDDATPSMDASTTLDARVVDSAQRTDAADGALELADASDLASGFCPGAMLPAGAAALPRCSRDDECSPAQGSRCMLDLRVSHCVLTPLCTSSEECRGDGGSNSVCADNGCGVRACIPPCSEGSCATGETCRDGVCEPLRCDSSSYTCPAPTRCAPEEADTDVHGCLWQRCEDTADCSCGSCVKGFCREHPGFCARVVSLP